MAPLVIRVWFRLSRSRTGSRSVSAFACSSSRSEIRVSAATRSEATVARSVRSLAIAACCGSVWRRWWSWASVVSTVCKSSRRSCAPLSALIALILLVILERWHPAATTLLMAHFCATRRTRDGLAYRSLAATTRRMRGRRSAALGSLSEHNRRSDRLYLSSGVVSDHKHQDGGSNAQIRVVCEHNRRNDPCTSRAGSLLITSTKTAARTPQSGSFGSPGAGRPTLALYGRAFHRSSAGSPFSSPSTDTVPVSSGNCPPTLRS